MRLLRWLRRGFFYVQTTIFNTYFAFFFLSRSQSLTPPSIVMPIFYSGCHRFRLVSKFLHHHHHRIMEYHLHCNDYLWVNKQKIRTNKLLMYHSTWIDRRNICGPDSLKYIYNLCLLRFSPHSLVDFAHFKLATLGSSIFYSFFIIFH